MNYSPRVQKVQRTGQLYSGSRSNSAWHWTSRVYPRPQAICNWLLNRKLHLQSATQSAIQRAMCSAVGSAVGSAHSGQCSGQCSVQWAHSVQCSGQCSGQWAHGHTGGHLVQFVPPQVDSSDYAWVSQSPQPYQFIRLVERDPSSRVVRRRAADCCPRGPGSCSALSAAVWAAGSSAAAETLGNRALRRSWRCGALARG